MSVLPTSGIVVSAAGLPLAQNSGSERIRAQQAATAQQRRVDSEIRAEETAGIAAADAEEQETNDRDADGRRPWEFPAADAEATNALNQMDHFANSGSPADSAADVAADEIAPTSHDPLRESGGQLDLTG